MEKEKEIVKLVDSKKPENLSRLQKLLQHMGKDAVMKVKNDRGVPVLNTAILQRNIEAARLLLTYGADPFSTDNQGQTALHAAAQVDNASILVTMLTLAQNSDVNVQDDRGQTPLHIAVRNTSTETTGWLVFVGANPAIPNKACQTAREMTNKNQIHQLLRGFSKELPQLNFATLDPGQVFAADDLQYSIKLLNEPETSSKDCKSSAKMPTTLNYHFIYRAIYETKSSFISRYSEDEELIGPVTEYRLLDQLFVELTFQLTDRPEEQYEYVLRLIAEGGNKRDIVLSVQEIDFRQMATEEQPAVVPPEGYDDIDGNAEFVEPIPLAAQAVQRVKLDNAGFMALISRLTQQPVKLGPGHKTVQSKIDKRVELQVPDNFKGTLQGTLQLERSVPLKEKPAMVVQNEAPAEDMQVLSQSDYVKFISEDQTDSLPMEVLSVEMPLPADYSGGNMHVYCRTCSFDSATDSEADDNEKESRRWIKKEEVKPRTKNTFKVPMAVNKTITAVEPRQAVPEERVRRNIAKQYRKRKNKSVVFFVVARPWKGWLSCRELVVIVSAPSQLTPHLLKHLAGGFSLVQLTGEVKVPKFSTFRISLTGGLVLEDGTPQETISFRYAKSKLSENNHCKFIVRGINDTTIEGAVYVEKKKSKKVKGQDQWKSVGKIAIDLSNYRVPEITQEVEDKAKPFTDTLLMEMARELPAAEMAQFGILMGLKQVDVDNILTNSSYFSPVFKSFQILKSQKNRCQSSAEFGASIAKAFRDMSWNLQLEWLFDRLKESQWNGLAGMRAHTWR